MMIGRVDETHFDATVMKILYVVFGYVVAILLANVLIAIVTAYYGVVRNQRARELFFFVAHRFNAWNLQSFHRNSFLE